VLIYDLSLSDLTSLLHNWDEPVFRARQVWQGLYKQYWNDPKSFTQLPNHLRSKLANTISFEVLLPVSALQSSDEQTIKTLFKLPDGQAVEAVMMRYDKRVTLCLSSQVGCAMGCVFCATGQMGYKRHLTSGEIVAQVMHYARLLDPKKETITNIVLMGMGEPFHNYDNTMAAIDRLNDPEGFAFGARRFTVSTVGLIPSIERFAAEKRQVNLAISLHSGDDAVRSLMLPINKKYPVDELLATCRDYVAATGRRITFEWALVDGINDTPGQARLLAGKLRGMLCHVNAIPLNPTQGYSGKGTNRERAEIFKATLIQAGIPCTLRLRRGMDIQAGCGQLASRN
jgi:23S rRNA (adenine2503-C2)-methyltransferase